jgi:hypothetical protein
MMANTITNRRTFSYGSKKFDTGDGNPIGNGDYFESKLGRVDWGHIYQRPAANTPDSAMAINSITASTVEDDAGFVYVGTNQVTSFYQLIGQ